MLCALVFVLRFQSLFATRPSIHTVTVALGTISIYTCTECINRNADSMRNHLESSMRNHPEIHSRTGNSKGYGFVSLQSGYKAAEAVEHLNGLLVEGRRIKVELRRQQQVTFPEPPQTVYTPSPVKYGLMAHDYQLLMMNSPPSTSSGDFLRRMQ